MLLFSGCKTPEPKPEPKPVPERVPEKPKRQSFVPPTAEQGYRLQDDCTRRGDWVLKNNIYKPDGGRAYLGFGCPDVGCIEEKVSPA
jgi:hypothetical protein